MKKQVMFIVLLLLSFILFACGSDKNVTITFQTNGGVAIEDRTYDLEGDSFVLPVPVREGFTFEGWFLDETLTEPFTLASIMSKKTVTLYAKWVEEVLTFTITFESNGGSAVAPMSALEGATISPPSNPTRSGYTFVGWYLDASLTTPYTFTTMPGNHLTLYAKWDPVILQSTITFETNGGSLITSITQDVGSVVSQPSDPIRSGYTFSGWFSDSGLTTPYTFSTMPAVSVTVYAKWDPVILQSTITFQTNGGSPINSITQDVGTPVIQPPNPVREGYTFLGWYVDVLFQTGYTFGNMPSVNITLYAQWVVNNYVITYQLDNGDTIDQHHFSYGQVITGAPTPEKTGYTFIGWHVTIPTTMPANDLLFIAQFEINTYTISFEMYGANPLDDIDFEYGEILVIPVPDRLGYTFEGWYMDAELSIPFSLGSMPAYHITLHAKWQVIPHYLLIYIVLDEEPIVATYYEDELIDLITGLEREGYLFVGWYSDPLTLIPFEVTHMPAHDITIYAKFTPLSYVLSYDTDGGTVIDPHDLYMDDKLIIPPMPTKEGYLFDGWFYDTAFAHAVDFEHDRMPAHDLTLYARWMTDDGYMPIGHVLAYEPEDEIFVRGNIVYKFPDQMAHPGFYLYDGTGTIFVLSATTHDVGQGVEFSAHYSVFEYTPQLIVSGDIYTNESELFPDHVPMSHQEVANGNPHDRFLFGTYITLTGVMMQHGPQYYITSLSMSVPPVAINYKSLVGINPFMDKVGQTVTFHAFIHGYQPEEGLWYVVYAPVGDVVVIEKTTAEKLAELESFVLEELDGMTFMSGQLFKFPENDPVYGSSLSVETYGDHAAYYNPETGLFLETDIERIITYTLTITLDAQVIEVELTFILVPLTLLTIEQFKSLNENDYGVIQGVVVLLTPFGLAVIADAFDMLIVTYSEDFTVGDLVVIGGYKQYMEGLVVMSNHPEDIVIEILSTNNDNPLLPISINLETFASIPAHDPSYWLHYYEITGQLAYDEKNSHFILTDGTTHIMVIAIDDVSFNALLSSVDMVITLRGFAIPMDHFLYNKLSLIYADGTEGIFTNYSDEELLSHIEMLLGGYLSQQTYQPGQTIELPIEHPIYPIVVTYETSGEHALLFDVLTGIFSEDIDEEIWINLTVTLTFHEITYTFETTLHVKPGQYLSVTAFIEEAIEGTSYYVVGIVVFTMPEHGIVFIADETSMIVAPLYTFVQIGDHVLLYGQLFSMDGFTFIASTGDELLIQIMSHGHENPLTVIPLSLSEMASLDPNDLSHQFLYVEISGMLEYEPSYDLYFLVDETSQIPIWPMSMMQRDLLDVYRNQKITIRGITLSTNDPEHMMLMLVFLGNEDDIHLAFTALEFAMWYADYINDMLETQTFEPGSYQPFMKTFAMYDVEFVYTGTGPNGHLYDVSTGYIDGSITEEIDITFEAVVFIDGIETLFYEFTMHVAPIASLSVSDFLVSDPLDGPYYVSGVIIYEQSLSTVDVDMLYVIADEHHVLFIRINEYLTMHAMVRIHGHLVVHHEQTFVQPLPHDQAIVVLSFDHENPLMHEAISIQAFKDLDPFLSTNFFVPYQLTGLIEYKGGSHFVVKDAEGREVMIYLPSPAQFDFIHMYDGHEVKIRGLSLRPGVENFLVLLYIGFEMDIEPAYTTEEYVDYLAEQLPLYYSSRFFVPGQHVVLPDGRDDYPITYTYSVLSEGIFYVETGYISFEIETEVDIEIEVIIAGGTHERTIVIIMHVIPYVEVSIGDFINGEEGVLYMIHGVVVLDTPDDDDGPQMIHDGLHGVFIMNKFIGLNLGDYVTIVSYLGDFNGFMVVNLNGDAILFDVPETGHDFPMAAVPMTFESFSNLDMLDVSNWGMYVSLTGYVSVSYVDGYFVFELYEDFYAGESIVIYTAFSDDYHLYLEVAEYNGLLTTIKGFVIPDFIGDDISSTPGFLYMRYDGSISFNYDTELERINALIQKGDYFLQGKTFYPYDTLELPDFDFLLSVAMSWEIVSGDASVYDVETGMFGYVDDFVVLIFECTFETAFHSVTHQFTIYVEPRELVNLSYFINFVYDYGLTSGVIVAVMDDGQYLLADESHMIILTGFDGLNMFDEIIIYGKHIIRDGTHYIDCEQSHWFLVSEDAQLDVDVIPYSISELTAIHPWGGYQVRYYSLYGRLLYEEDTMWFYLSTGFEQVMIQPMNSDIFTLLLAYENQDVHLHGFLYQFEETDEGWCWILLFRGLVGEIEIVSLDNTYATAILYQQVVRDLSIDMFPNETYQYTLSHPYFGGSVSLMPHGINGIYMSTAGPNLYIYNAPAPCLILVEIHVNFGGEPYVGYVNLRIHPESGVVPFVPGEFGAVPYFENTLPEGMFAGLYIEMITNQNNVFSDGFYHRVDLKFPIAESLDADVVILQYYDDVTMTWKDYKPYGEVLMTDYDNFSVEIFEPMTFRLITSGRLAGELVSNSVYAEISLVESTFSFYGLQSGIFGYSSVHVPYVGCAFELIGNVVDLDWNYIEYPPLQYSWYRVNPYTYEMIEILGETDSVYITTYDDVGYYIFGRISGDEITVGGYVHMTSWYTIQVYNPVYATNRTDEGFTLHFGYAIRLEDLEDFLMIKTEWGDEVSFNVYETDVDYIFIIACDLTGIDRLELSLDSYFWKLGFYNKEHHVMLPKYFI